MKFLIWFLALLILAPWTGGAWLTWALVDFSGNWLSGNADMLAAEPEVVESLSWLARVASGLGETVIIVIWAIGTAIVAGLAWALGRMVDRDRRLKALNWHPDDPRAAAAGQQAP
ncbi:MAG: hypothetical protein AB7O49_15420 [Sphingomonadales bacterium]